MTQNRFYSSVAVKTTLNGLVTAGATTLVVTAATGFPASVPFTLILERDTANEEVVTVTAVSTLTLTVTRAQDGTTGVSHATGAVVEHGVSARDYSEPQAHIAASSAVHGITGSVVGTGGAQTLTSKTLTTPVINGSGGTLTLPAGPDTFVGRATTDTLTNKTLTTPTIASIKTNGGAATVTLPASTDTLVGRATTDTLTNKTLNGAVLDAASTHGGVSGTSLAALFSAWATWTPTFTNITSGGGYFSYLKIGKTVLVNGYFNGGTVTSTGAITVSMPGGLSAGPNAPTVGVAVYGLINFPGFFGYNTGIQSGSLASGTDLTGVCFSFVLEVG